MQYVFGRGPGFYLSFNDGKDKSPASQIFELLGLLAGLESKGSETALVIKPDDAPEGSRGTFYVLSGDFREAYFDLLRQRATVGQLMGLYEDLKIEHRSDWSEDRPHRH